ncbi:MAG: phage minor head protein [bacterium]
MLTLDALSRLTEAIDAFLEAVSRADKLRVVEPAERKIEKLMSRLFSEQGRVFAREHERYKAEYPMEESARDELEKIMAAVSGATAEEMSMGLVEILGPVMDEAAKDFIAQFGAEDFAEKAFSLDNPKAVKFLEDHAASMVTKIDATTRDQMRTLLTHAADEGWSYGKTAKAIKDRFDGFAGLKPQLHIESRAHLVAVTESRMAYEEANLQTALGLQAAGLEMEKYWMNSGDSRVSDGCRDNTAAGWIPIDEDFPSGDAASPRFPGCRCDVHYRMKED